MKSVRQGPKHWLALLVAGVILFAGGGGMGYMLGQQQAQSAQKAQLKNSPKGTESRPSGKPNGMPAQNHDGSN